MRRRAALVLLVSMFLPWFSVEQGPGDRDLCGQGVEECSGFDTFHFFTTLIIPGMDLLLVAGHSLRGSWSGSSSAGTRCPGRRARSR